MKRGFVLTCSLFLAATAGIPAQRPARTADRIAWVNAYADGTNPALEALHAEWLDSLKSWSEIYLYAETVRGEQRNVTDPSEALTAGIGTLSRRNLGDVLLKGYFGYAYDWKDGCTWSGWSRPDESPFAVVDTISGPVLDERYRMGAELAWRPGPWLLGVRGGYAAEERAKTNDIRSGSRRMEFSLRAGAGWCGDRLRLGLDLGYDRRTERLNFVAVNQQEPRYILELYGLWTGAFSVFSSSQYDRYRSADRWVTALQAEYDTGSLCWSNSLEISLSDDSQTEPGYNGKRYGDYRMQVMDYRSYLRFGLFHRLELNALWSRGDGFRFLQRVENDPASGVSQWVTYSRMHTYRDAVREAGLTYRFRPGATTWEVPWEFGAGFRFRCEDRSVLEYPQRLGQKWAVRTVFFSVRREWARARSRFQAGLQPDFRWGNGTEAAYVNEEPEQIPGGTGDWMLREPLRDEYLFRTAPAVRLSLSLRWTIMPERTDDRAFYVGLTAAGTAGCREMAGKYRSGLLLRTGWLF